jgi:hypothetical protein
MLEGTLEASWRRKRLRGGVSPGARCELRAWVCLYGATLVPGPLSVVPVYMDNRQMITLALLVIRHKEEYGIWGWAVRSEERSQPGKSAKQV